MVEPAFGYLACGDTGAGKMPDPEYFASISISANRLGKGYDRTTCLSQRWCDPEAIDPGRYITNHSTGKMGYAIAENAMQRGASVTLVTEPPL